MLKSGVWRVLAGLGAVVLGGMAVSPGLAQEGGEDPVTGDPVLLDQPWMGVATSDPTDPQAPPPAVQPSYCFDLVEALWFYCCRQGFWRECRRVYNCDSACTMIQWEGTEHLTWTTSYRPYVWCREYEGVVVNGHCVPGRLLGEGWYRVWFFDGNNDCASAPN